MAEILAKDTVIGQKYLSPKGYPFTVVNKQENVIQVTHEVEGYGLQQTTMPNETQVVEVENINITDQNTEKDAILLVPVKPMNKTKPKTTKTKPVKTVKVKTAKSFGELIKGATGLYTKRAYLPVKTGQAIYLSGNEYLLVDLNKERVIKKVAKVKVLEVA